MISSITNSGGRSSSFGMLSLLVVVLCSSCATILAAFDECKPILEIEISIPGECPYNNVVDGECLTAVEVTNRAYQAIFVDHDPEAIRKYVAQDYIQHNPNVPNGVEPILGLAANVEEAGVIFDTYRIFGDGDTAVTHNVVDNAFPFGAEKFVVFDVFRTANGQVVEHWDNIQPFPEPNPSNRTVIDGPVMIKYLGETEKSLQVVTDFVDTVFVNGNVAAAPQFISNETYYQHNPTIADGLDTFMTLFQGLFDAGGSIEYDVKFVFAEGNYVLIMAEGYFGVPKNETDAYFDLFRVEGGLIVEHWDVIEHIPPLDDFLNGNGKW